MNLNNAETQCYLSDEMQITTTLSSGDTSPFSTMLYDYDLTGYYLDLTGYATTEPSLCDISTPSTQQIESPSLYNDNTTSPTSSHTSIKASKRQAARHRPSTASTQQHPCPHCPKTYSRPCDLNRHLLNHTRPFPCRHHPCHASFALNKDRTRHEQQVHGGKKEKCVVLDCVFATCRRDNLLRHMRLRHGLYVG